jgi:hypothetical protein
MPKQVKLENNTLNPNSVQKLPRLTNFFISDANGNPVVTSP